MRDVMRKTFGGLSAQYYLRQLFFSSLFAALIIYVALNGKSVQYGLILFVVVNTFLYPYSRFVYERVVGFVMGDNVFLVNALFMMFMKLFTMALCWSLALFIAPLGLAYLYYYHSKTAG